MIFEIAETFSSSTEYHFLYNVFNETLTWELVNMKYFVKKLISV